MFSLQPKIMNKFYLLLLSLFVSSLVANGEAETFEPPKSTMCSGSEAEFNNLASITTTGTGLWSNPAIWSSNQVPGQNDDVTISAGHTVTLNKDVTIKKLIVNGVLKADLNIDLHLTAQLIAVIGSGAVFEWGTDTNKYDKQGIISLKSDDISYEFNTNSNVDDMGNKFIMAMNNGTISIHGKTKKSWTQLDATANVGATSILLKDPVPTWEVGDRIVIASTGFDFEEAEVRTITSISTNKRILSLDQPLEYQHWGTLQSYQNGTRTLDERAEVGLLSRNITIQGVLETNAKFGGHIMVMGTGKAQIEGANLRHMGQSGRLGRYPFHWHKCGLVGGQYIRNSTIEKSFNRAITVHSTDGAEIVDNVAYDHIGHGFFLEDGSEHLNIFDGNLGLSSRAPLEGEHIQEHDLAQRDDRRKLSPATFWITNNDNTYINNVAAGSEGIGFWYIVPYRDFAGRFPNKDLTIQPIRKFENNVAHSCSSIGVAFNGYFFPDTIAGGTILEVVHDNTRTFNNPPNPTLKNNLAYKCSGNGLWTLTESAMHENWTLADNGAHTFHVFFQSFKNCLFVGQSDNKGAPRTAEEFAFGYQVPEPLFIKRRSRFNAFAFYDGPLGLENCHFANYPDENFNVMQILGAAVVSPSTQTKNLSFENVAHDQKLTFVPVERDGRTSQNHEEGVQSTALATLDPTFSGEVGTYTVDVVAPNTYYPYESEILKGPAGTLRPDWDAWFNPNAKYGVIESQSKQQSIGTTNMFLTRMKAGEFRTMTLEWNKNAKALNNQWKIMPIMSDNYVYRVQPTEVFEKWERMKLGHSAQNEYIDVEYVNIPAGFVIGNYGVPNHMIQEPSLMALRSQTSRTAYFFDDNTLHIRYVATNPNLKHATDYRVAVSEYLDINFNNAKSQAFRNAGELPIAEFNTGVDNRASLSAVGLPLGTIGSQPEFNNFNVYKDGDNIVERTDYDLNIGRQVWTGLPYLKIDFAGTATPQVFIKDGTTDHYLGVLTDGVNTLSLDGLATKLGDVNQIKLRFWEDKFDAGVTTALIHIKEITIGSGLADADGDGTLDADEKLSCRSASNAIDLGFDFNTEKLGWVANVGSNFETLEAISLAAPINTDPQIAKNGLNFSGNQANRIAVRFKSDEADVVSLYYTTTTGPNYSELKKQTFNYTTPGQWVKAVFDFSADTRWAGRTITSLLFDFPENTTGGGQVWTHIDYIRNDIPNFVTVSNVGTPNCGQSASFLANISFPTGQEYIQWQYNDGNNWLDIFGATLVNYTAPPETALLPHRVRGHRLYGCEVFSDPISANVIAPPTPTTQGNTTVCQSVALQTLTASPSGGYWTHDNAEEEVDGILSPIYINAGGPSSSQGGFSWYQDGHFLNGTTYSYSPNAGVANASSKEIYRTERNATGDLNYEITLPNGFYEINLHFAELWSGAFNPGARVFGIDIEGATVAPQIDIFNEVGGNAALIKSYNVNLTDGELNIDLTKITQNPKISGITILPRSFNPQDAGPGTHTMTYHYVNPTSGCAASKSTSITVNSAPSVATNGDQTICQNEAVSLIASSSNSGAANYKWYLAGTNTIVTNGATANVSPTQSTDYEARVTIGGCQSFPSDPVRVTVNPLPAQPTVPANQTVCQRGPALTLSASPDGGEWSGTGIVGSPIHINAGGPTVTEGGRTWQADQYFLNGNAYTANPAVNGTASQQIYKSERWMPSGDLNYAIPVANGDYQVRLYFAETYQPLQCPSARVFNIALEGTVIESNFEIYAEAGSNEALRKTYDVTVTGGVLDIAFLANIENPKINAISIFPRSFDRLGAGPGDHVLTYNYTDPATGCSRSKNVTYTVSNPPVATTSGNTNICLGESTTLFGTASSGATMVYRWFQVGVSGFISAQQNLTVSPTQNTTYHFYAIVDGCWSFVAPVSVNVNQPPAPPTVSSAQTLCQRGGNFNLTASPSGGTWSGPGITGANFNPTTAGPGIHQLTYDYTDANGCSSSNTTNFTVETAPVASVSGSTTICVGGSAVLTASATGTGTKTFSWYFAGTNTLVHQGQTYVVSPTQTTSYVILATVDGCLSYRSSNVTVTVNSLPGVPTVSGPQTLCERGAAINLTASPSGGVWSGSGISGNSFNPTTAGPGIHPLSYVYTNSNGCSNSNSTNFTVDAAPIALATAGSTSVCAGREVALNGSTSTSGSTFDYLWYLAGTSTQVSTQQNPVVSPLADTDYKMIVTVDGCASFPSPTISINVDPTNAVCFSAKAMMEGPFASGVMIDNLKENGFLVLTEPYTTLGFTGLTNSGIVVPSSVFTGSGANNDVVDWVVVQLRDKTNPQTVVASAAMLLEQDGEIITYEQGRKSSILSFNVPHDNYYLAIFHRNHLPIMTANPVPFNGISSIFDFTSNGMPTYGTGARTQLSTSLWGMITGDASSDNEINAQDRSDTWNSRNQSGYLLPDVTLDGNVDAADRSKTWNNRNKTGTIDR